MSYLSLVISVVIILLGFYITNYWLVGLGTIVFLLTIGLHKVIGAILEGFCEIVGDI